MTIRFLRGPSGEDRLGQDGVQRLVAIEVRYRESGARGERLSRLSRPQRPCLRHPQDARGLSIRDARERCEGLALPPHQSGSRHALRQNGLACSVEADLNSIERL